MSLKMCVYSVRNVSTTLPFLAVRWKLWNSWITQWGESEVEERAAFRQKVRVILNQPSSFIVRLQLTESWTSPKIWIWDLFPRFLWFEVRGSCEENMSKCLRLAVAEVLSAEFSRHFCNFKYTFMFYGLFYWGGKAFSSPAPYAHAWSGNCDLNQKEM